MCSAVRAIRCGVAAPLRFSSWLFVVISTLSGRSRRNDPSAIACSEPSEVMYAANSPSVLNDARSPVPLDMTQAEPSLSSVPSSVRLMRLVSGPPIFVMIVMLITAPPSSSARTFSARRVRSLPLPAGWLDGRGLCAARCTD